MRKITLLCTAVLVLSLCSCSPYSGNSSMEPTPSESISTMETTAENDEMVTTTESIETTSKKDEQTAAATEMMTEQETGSEPETASNQETEIGTESAEESTEPETGSETGTEAESETGSELLEYSASGKGAVGKITVTIWVQDGVLVDCEIDASKESEDKGQIVATEYQAAIMSGTMVDDLDSVSGASMSSATIKKLLRKCFEEAGIEH